MNNNTIIKVWIYQGMINTFKFSKWYVHKLQSIIMEGFNFHQYHLSLTQGSRINEIGGKHDDLS